MALGTCLDASSASANQIKAAVNSLASGKVSLWQTCVDSSFLPPSRWLPLLPHLRQGWERAVRRGAPARAPSPGLGRAAPAAGDAPRLHPEMEARRDPRTHHHGGQCWSCRQHRTQANHAELWLRPVLLVRWDPRTWHRMAARGWMHFKYWRSLPQI